MKKYFVIFVSTLIMFSIFFYLVTMFETTKKINKQTNLKSNIKDQSINLNQQKKIKKNKRKIASAPPEITDIIIKKSQMNPFLEDAYQEYSNAEDNDFIKQDDRKLIMLKNIVATYNYKLTSKDKSYNLYGDLFIYKKGAEINQSAKKVIFDGQLFSVISEKIQIKDNDYDYDYNEFARKYSLTVEHKFEQIGLIYYSMNNIEKVGHLITKIKQDYPNLTVRLELLGPSQGR